MRQGKLAAYECIRRSTQRFAVKTISDNRNGLGQNKRFVLPCRRVHLPQVADSLGHLDKKKGRGIDAVTAVRVSADDRETQRRMAEEHARQERLQHLQVHEKNTYHGGMTRDIPDTVQYFHKYARVHDALFTRSGY